MLEELKAEVFRLNLELPRQGLVTWTSGNVSVRDRASGLVVIKPSGLRYEEMHAEQMGRIGEYAAKDWTPRESRCISSSIWSRRGM